MTKFELVRKYAGQNELLPKRKTQFSAGYDLKAAEDVTIPGLNGSNEWLTLKTIVDASTLIPTLAPPLNKSTNVEIFSGKSGII